MWRLVIGVCGALAAAGWAGYTHYLPAVGTQAAAAAPASVLGPFADDPPVRTAAEWRARRVPRLRQAFEAQVYGALPEGGRGRVLSRSLLADDAFGGAARVEQLTIGVVDGPPAVRMNVLLVLPRGASASAPAPTIVMESFCGNRAALPAYGDAIELIARPPRVCDGTLSATLARMVFGRYANGPPFRAIADRGYAVATFYAGDVAPDDAKLAPPALARLMPEASPERRPGAVAAWSWSYSRVIDVLDEDPRLDRRRTAVWGHSRNGKAALLAGAFDERIDAVIAHQSGRGGASLSRRDVGESVAQITQAYPHWFAPAFGRDVSAVGAVDQHQLLALIAPRPVLLGNARRDRWSDPQGAFLAARGADAAYELHGVEGLRQPDLARTDLQAKIAFYMRDGRHGVTSEDWRTFLAFLDHHFPPRS